MATTFLVPKNNAYSTLASGITDVALSLSVAAGEGARFPSTYPFHITIDSEILECTNRAVDTLTVTRAAESTSAATHDAGATVRLNITAEALSDLNTAVNAIENGSMLDNTAGGTDGEITKASTANVVFDINTVVNDHNTRHEYGGADEINALVPLMKAISTNYLVYKNWANFDGFSTGGTGTAPSSIIQLATIATGATSGQTSYIYGGARWSSGGRLYISCYPGVAPAAETCYIGLYTNPTAPTDNEKHTGFKVVNGRIYASNGDGADYVDTDTGVDMALNTPVNLYFVQGATTILYYVNDVLKVTIINHHSTLNDPVYPTFHIVNSANVNHNLNISTICYYHG